jgi:hypothetical protein
MSVAVETGLWQLGTVRSTVTVQHKTMWGLATATLRFTRATAGPNRSPALPGETPLPSCGRDRPRAPSLTHGAQQVPRYRPGPAP